MIRTPKRARTTLAALAVSLVLVAAGCGSSDSGSGDDGDAGASGSKTPVALEGNLNDEGTEDISGEGQDAAIEIDLEDSAFRPTFIKAEPGATVTIELSNVGDNPHTFTLDDESVDKEVEPGKTATVEVTVPEDGSLRFSCAFHGSMGMQGAFYTGDGESGGGSGGGATTTEPADTKGGY